MKDDKMEKTKLIDFVITTQNTQSGHKKYCVIDTRRKENNIILGDIDNFHEALQEKRRFFAQKLTIEPENNGLFNLFFDGKELGFPIIPYNKDYDYDDPNIYLPTTIENINNYLLTNGLIFSDDKISLL